MTVSLCNKRRKVMPSSIVAALPDEIMTDVFLRLPIKSILRFRAVCRSCDALLSSEEFCALHMAATEVAPTTPKLMFISPTTKFDSTAIYSCSLLGLEDDLLFTLDNACGNFVDVAPAPCRGLTLLYDVVAPAYYVCNAATRAVTQLPPCQDVPCATAGLGFDTRTEEYKVVRIRHGNQEQHLFCEVYTLGSDHGDHWRPVAGGVPFRFSKFAYSAIENAVHYKMQPLSRAGVLSFSLTSETFSWVRSPPFFVSSQVHLVELDSHLCMVRDLRSNLPAGGLLEIWKLKDYSSGDWSMNHRIDLSEHVSRDFLEPRVVKVIGSFGNNKSNNRIIIATFKHKVFAYDPMSKTLETIHSTMAIQSSHQIEPSDIRFSLLRQILVPVHKTKEEIALSFPLAKVTREILLRLPAESVHEFKLVCKQWLRLITSESFSHAYILHRNLDRRLKIMLVGKGSGQTGFSFVPLNKWLQKAIDQDTLFDIKVVCSKPCHGLNLVSIEKKDYLYNPCIGFQRIYRNEWPVYHRRWNIPADCFRHENNPFAFGSKNVGLGFNLLTQEHVVVEISFQLKDYNSRQYYLACSIWYADYGFRHLPPPAHPVNNMPPAYLDGMMYWMSEPRLGDSNKRAIISFNIATRIFDVIPCPSRVETWKSNSLDHAFVVELEGVLCAVLADPIADELDIWKWELGQWDRKYTIYLKSWPDYSPRTNIVVPLAIDPADRRVLLSTGRKLGLYDPLKQTTESYFTLETSGASLRENLSRCNDQSKEELNRTS
ncbi:hypothetical protein BS78_09G220700, partial [Paspalum vaginatum]